MSKKKQPKYHLYKIVWQDACAEGGWEKMLDTKTRLLEVMSVGWLTAEDKQAITLSQSLTDAGRNSDRIHIPKAWITKKVLLKGHHSRYGQ